MEFRVAAAILLIAVSAVYSQDIMNLCKQTEIKPGSHFIRSPNNCSEFFLCNAMFPLPLACGKGTVFSQSQQICVWLNSQYDDCNRIIYGGKFNDPICSQFPFGLNRDPNDCHRFIPCYNRTSYPSMACQAGLFFSVNEQRCTTEGTANCRIQ
uniref:Chitin-binding type-2 domain-containing protein n=1 Tax=Octopus bimaculoides TaxID=37653 RepID=A0A0L8H4B7_OCTBM